MQPPPESPSTETSSSPSILTSTSSVVSDPSVSNASIHQLEFDSLKIKHEKLLKENAEAVRQFKLLEQIHLDAVNEFDKQQSLMYAQMDEVTQSLRACEGLNKKLMKGEEITKYKETCRLQQTEIENLNKKIDCLNSSLKQVGLKRVALSVH